MKSNKLFIYLCTISAILLVPQFAFAYVGPGTGLSAIGAFLAFIFAIFVGILGFFWYPVKRLLRKKRREPEAMEESQS